MRIMRYLTLLTTLLLLFIHPAFGQDSLQRPTPYPVSSSIEFQQAVGNQTRTAHGAPGPNYWTNTASYAIDGVLSPSTRQLRGHEKVVYTNNSPDSLHYLVLHLRQNLHKPGAIRNRSVEITGGMHLSYVAVDEQALVEQHNRQSVGLDVGYVVDGTLMYVTLAEPLGPEESTELTLAWSFKVPQTGAPRMGQENKEVFFLGYWYPQMAVYDDVQGWDTDPYMGNGEFYMGYADYNVELTVPEGWLVAGTGQLQNAKEVLTPAVQERLKSAATQDSIVTVVGADKREAGVSTQKTDSGQLTWHFQASKVRDFALSTSKRYVWDATHAEVSPSDSAADRKTVMIHALYRPETKSWTRSAEFARFSIEHLSEMIIPYRYPQMTCVEGIIGGGMEYPMITLIGGARSNRSLFNVTYHEISHMWLPMMVGVQETDYTWMDEGLTSFNTKEGANAFFNESRAWDPNRQYYFYIAGTRDDVPPMRHADRYPVQGPSRIVASYNKPALVFHALRGIVGEQTFFKAYRTFARRWVNKHPYPHDLFNTFEEVVGKDLDWFWTSLLYESWTMDQAIEHVTQIDDGLRVTIVDKGKVPMPVLVKASYTDGTTRTKRLPVNVWLEGAQSTDVIFPAGKVARIELDPQAFLPDINRMNNTWEGNL